VVPDRLQRASREIDPLFDRNEARSDRIGQEEGLLAFAAYIEISLQGQAVLGGNLPVGAKTAAQLMPRIAAAPIPVEIAQLALIGIFAIDAISPIGSPFPAVLQRGGPLKNIAALRRDQCAGRIGGPFGEKMLMTPFTALAPQIVPPGPRMTSIRSMSSRGRSTVSTLRRPANRFSDLPEDRPTGE